MLDTLSDLENLINNTVVENKTIVYFDNQGKIYKIGPESTEFSHLFSTEIHFEEVKDLVNGKNFLHEYKVSLNAKTQKYEIIRIDSEKFEFNNFVRLPHITDIDEPEVIVCADYKQNAWIIKVSTDLAQEIFFNNKNLTNLLTISITHPNDPNVLFRSISQKLDSFISHNKKSQLFEHIYKGIIVDIWQSGVHHLSGQHVYYKNAVYRIKENQKDNTEFDENNAELILPKVKVYSDKNVNTKIDSKFAAGDHILIDNQLFLFRGLHDSEYIETAIAFEHDFEFNKELFSVYMFNNFTNCFEVIDE